MKITEFTRIIAKLEHKKKQVSIAQIAEILKIINDQTGGVLYKMIKNDWIKSKKEFNNYKQWIQNKK